MFCCNTHTFVTTEDVFCVCRDKSKLVIKIMFVATNILSRQNFCRDKNMFVMTTFVVTKMMHVAAPANDNCQGDNAAVN